MFFIGLRYRMLSMHIVYGFIEAAFELCVKFDKNGSDAESRKISTFCV